MNKKILTSLLMTPLAFGAMAVIPPVAADLQKPDGWTQTGISGETNVFTSDGVRCPIEAGQLKRTLENLRPGKYNMVFTDAYNVKATVDEVECVKDETNANVLTFTVSGDEKKTVTLIIEAAASGGFGFDALQINFGFDFAAAVVEFNNQLPDIPEVSNKKSALLESADYKEVTDKVKAIKELIAKLEDETTQLDAYDNFQLWKYEAGEDLISTAIKQLNEQDKDKVEAVKTKVNQVNEVYALQGRIDNYKNIFNKAVGAIAADYKYKAEVTAYAEGKRDEKVNEMQGLIDALESEVVNAATPVSEESFEASKKEVDDKLKEYVPEIHPVENNIYVNDAKAYYDMVSLYDSLKETYTKDLGTIIALQGVKGEFENKDTYDYADAFNAKSTEWQEKLKGYFTTAETAIVEATGATKGDDGKYAFNGGEAIEGAAGKLKAVKAVVEDIMNTQMEECTFDCTITVKDQNTKMLEAITAIHDQEILIPETLPAELAEEAEALKGQLTELLKVVEDKYAALELPVAEFDTKIAEIAEKVQKFSTIPDLTKAYDDLAKYIDENVNNPENTEVENVIKGRFDESLRAIKANMDALVLGDDISQVLQSIANTKATAEKLVKAQADAWTVLQDYKEFLDGLDAKFKNLDFVDGVTEEEKASVATNSDYASLYDTYNKSKADFDAAGDVVAVSNQEAYEKLVKVAADLENVELEDSYDIIAMQKDYIDAVMALNKDKVSAKYVEVEDIAGDGQYHGQDEVTKQLSELKNAFNAVDINNAINVGNLDKADEVANNICKELNEILTSLTCLDSDIARYKANQEWADKQEDALMGLLNPDNKFEALREVNNATSWSPAKDYFVSLIDGYFNTKGRLMDEAVESSIPSALKKGIAEGAEEARAEVQAKVEKLVADVTGLSDRITNNHASYRNLLEIAETTQNAIQSAQDALNTNMNESGLAADDERIVDWQKCIDALLNNGKDQVPVGLTELNRQTGEYYGTGVAHSNEIAMKEEYDKLISAADALINEINTGIGDAVVAANSAYYGQWEPIYNALRGEYKTTLDAFNAYGSGNITNADFYNYLLEKVVIGDVQVLGNHEPVYDYSSKITELDKTVRDYIKAQSAARKAINNDAFNAETAPAADLTAGMQKLVTDMQTQAANAAIAYFVDVVAKNAQATIDEAKADMIAKGCTEAIAADYVKFAEDRVELWGKFLSSEGDVVSQVNFIAEESKLIPGGINKEAAAAKTWSDAHKAAATQLDKWAKDIETFSSKDAEVEKAFNDAKAAIEAMSNTSLDTLKDNLAALGEQKAAAEEAYNALKAKHDADTTTKEFNDTIADLREDNDALNEYAEGLAGSPADVDIAAKIDAIEDDVKNSKDIVADKKDIEKSIEDVKAAIANGYTSLVESEYYKLDQLMAKILDAYQVVAEKMTPEDAAAKKTEIDELQKAVDDLYNANKDGITDSADYKSKAQNLEIALANEFVNLSDAECVELTDARTAIDAKYQEVLNAVNDGKAALGELVKDEYESKYDALIKDLGEIVEKAQGAGSEVLLYQDTYVSQIAAVAADLEALNAEAEAAQAAAEEKAAIAETTAANVEALNAELEAAGNALATAKAKVTDWGVEEWNTFLGNLDGRIEAIRGDIDTEGTITEENADGITEAEKADLLAAIKSLYTEMNYYVESAATNYASNANEAANTAVSEARAALTGTTVVNSAALSDSIGKQETALETELNKLTEALETAEGEARIEAYETFAEAAKGVKDAVAGIIEEIAENTYILGDVDGSKGEPDANDVMTLLGWIGQKLTLDDLANDATAKAADINGDGKLDIADAAALFRLIMTEPGQRPARIVAARSGEGDAIYALTRTGEEAGSRIYSLSLNNSGDFVGAQVDIKLPVGMTLVDAQMTERASGHEVQIYDNGNGNYRLLIFSAENAAFQGNAGELLNLTIEGIGTPVVEEMVLSTPACAAVLGHAADTNMIDSIIEGAHNMKERIYNAAGQSLRAVQRGINIIRHSDGSTTKELHK